MAKFFSLTKTLMKANFDVMLPSGKSKKSKKKIGGVFLILLYLFAFASIAVPSVMGLRYIMNSYPSLSGVIFAFMLFVTSMIILIFSIFTIPSIYYYGKDVPMLLPLPIRAEMIIGSKFFISYIYELFFSVPIIGLMLGAYFSIFGFSFYILIFGLLAMFLIPILPIIYISVAMMLLIRFTPLFRNKERFNLFVGLFGIAFAVSISLFSSSLSSGNTAGIMEAIISGKFTNLFAIFPTNGILMNSFDGNALYLILFIVLNVIAIAIFLFIAKLVYFKGALNIADTTSKKVKLSDDAINKRLSSKSAFKACVKKESVALRRNTTYLLNCVLAPYIVPIAMFAGMFLSINRVMQEFGESIDPQAMIVEFQKQPIFIAIVIFVGLGMGLLLSSSSSISSTGLSREGEQAATMKYIPVSFKTQMLAKVYVSVYYMFLPLLLFSVGSVFIGISILNAAIFFVTSMLASTLASYIGIYIDLLHPKLTWTQESAAVKQNLNSLFHMLIIFALAGIITALGILVKLPLFTTAIIACILMIVLSVALHFGLNKMSNYAFSKI